MANSSFTENEVKLHYLIFTTGKEYRHGQSHDQHTCDIVLICGNLTMSSNSYVYVDECAGLWSLSFVIIISTSASTLSV